MADAADHHHLDEYYFLKWIVSTELASVDEGDAALELMKQYVEARVGGDREAQSTCWDNILEQVLAEINKGQPTYSASSWQALKEAVVSQKAAILAEKLEFQFEKGILVERKDYEALFHVIEEAKKRVQKRVSITRKNDRERLRDLELLKEKIEEYFPHY
ncbi:MAG: hypothetical protein KR126chlam2_01021, partial [Chlamydiae bacterium]|nr:hypothetical protein [Chlamydiota bacterium]